MLIQSSTRISKFIFAEPIFSIFWKGKKKQFSTKYRSCIRRWNTVNIHWIENNVIIQLYFVIILNLNVRTIQSRLTKYIMPFKWNDYLKCCVHSAIAANITLICCAHSAIAVNITLMSAIRCSCWYSYFILNNRNWIIYKRIMFLIDKALFKLMCRFMLCSFVLPCIYDCAAVVVFF